MFVTTGILKQIKKEYDLNKLSHCYLLCGSPEDSKTIVEDVLKYIQGGDRLHAIDNIFCKDDGEKFGVVELRKIQNQLQMTSSSNIKSLYLENIERLSTPALNSMLKILEEPPNNTVFFLTTKNLNSILETIVSRCRVYELNTTQDIDYSEIEGDLSKLRYESDVFGFVENFKSKDECVNWISKLVFWARNEYKLDLSDDLVDMVILCQRTLNDIDKNVNFKLACEVLLLRVLPVVSRINSKFK